MRAMNQPYAVINQTMEKLPALTPCYSSIEQDSDSPFHIVKQYEES